MTKPMEIGELATLLNARAAALAAELLPKGSRQGHEWVEAATRAGGLGDSLKVHIGGARPGIWSHFAAGQGGDALDLVAYLLFNGDKRQAVAWARRWLGLDHGDAKAMARIGAEAKAVAARARKAADLAEAESRRRAQGLWLSAREGVSGTPVELYLAGRGIDLASLERDPGALRYHPGLFNKESERHWPAMLAAICGADGRFLAVHRTWLEVRRDGRVTKAPLQDAKMTWGRYAGGLIRLWHGRRPDGKMNPPLGRAKAPTTLYLSEGIEDGLSVAVADESRRIAAAVSLGNMVNLALPDCITELVILRQNDPQDSQAARTLDKVLRHQVKAGRTVKVASPPPGVKDWNDWLVRSQKSDVRGQKSEGGAG